MRIIAVSGGIGAGKSVVCRIVRAMGYPVYDCDSRARAIMDSDAGIKQAIASSIHPDCITPAGAIDRGRLSAIVFADACALERLNGIVHSAVRADVAAWIAQQTSPVCFIETAILYQSGLDLMVSEVWEVTAPVPVRIERAALRSRLSAEQVAARVEAQDGYLPPRCHPAVRAILNDGEAPLLPQVERLLKNPPEGQ